jgi:FXSXX-COOH protein
MMEGSKMPDAPDGSGTALIDVTGLTLRDLETISESSLAAALRHVLDEEQAAPVAGFQSRI